MKFACFIISNIFAFTFLFILNFNAQTAASNFKTYDKDSLKFDYPADWTLSDRSNDESQNLYLFKEKSKVLIAVIVPRTDVATQKQLLEVQTEINSKYVAAVSKNLHAPLGLPEREYLCLEAQNKGLPGVRFSGDYNSEPSKGDIFSFLSGNRLVTLVFMRTDKENATSDKAWHTVADTLNITANGKLSADPLLNNGAAVEGNILNSKALSLSKPLSGRGGASGIVEVRVIVNEQGKVTYAKAISGNSLLWADSVAAARQSKFSPTKICNHPVKLTGIIIYNFESAPYIPRQFS